MWRKTRQNWPQLLLCAMALLAVFGLGGTAAAQQPTATISEVVKDATGAVVPGARITVSNVGEKFVLESRGPSLPYSVNGLKPPNTWK